MHKGLQQNEVCTKKVTKEVRGLGIDIKSSWKKLESSGTVQVLFYVALEGIP